MDPNDPDLWDWDATESSPRARWPTWIRVTALAAAVILFLFVIASFPR
jgi:hypothetical protein